MTAVIEERDLCRVRLRFLDLCKSFFAGEPDAEQLARWRGIFAALARAHVSPAFSKESAAIAALLWKKSLSELQNEYSQLFANPLARQRVATTISSYRNGRTYGKAAVREIMVEAGLVRHTVETVPEDGLVVLLDLLMALVEEEKTGEEWRARELQDRLLTELLVPLAEQLAAALDGNDCADFYLCCSRLLCSYLDLEKGLAEDR